MINKTKIVFNDMKNYLQIVHLPVQAPFRQKGVLPLQGPPVVPQWQAPLTHLSTDIPVQASIDAEHLQIPLPLFPDASQYSPVC